MTGIRVRRAKLVVPVSILALVPLLIGAGSAEDVKFKVVTSEHWLHGDQADQVHKLDRVSALSGSGLDGRAPTFDETAPTSANTESSAQLTFNSSNNSGQWGGPVGNLESIYWIGDFSGVLVGDLSLDLYWTRPPGLELAGQSIRIKVWADPDWAAGTGTLVGQLDNVTIAPGTDVPKLINTLVPVSGTVDGELVVQVQSRIDTNSGYLVVYDSADYPSSFTASTLVPCEPDDPDPACQ